MRQIPDSNNVARYCDIKSISPTSNRISGTGFKLRKRDKGKLSTNWIEYISSTLNQSPQQHLIDLYNGLMKETTGAKIAIINVKNTIDYVKKESRDNRKLDICYNGKQDSYNPSHSVIIGAELDDMEISDLIAEMVHTTYPF